MSGLTQHNELIHHNEFSGDGGAAIDQIPQLPIWLWATMLAGIGGAEQLRFVFAAFLFFTK